MLSETTKALYYFITVFSLLSFILLFKNNKSVFVLFITLISVSIVWRSFSYNQSSRYYSIFIYYGIILSSYAFISIKQIKKPIKHLLCLAVLLALLFSHCIKLATSYNNVYVLDVFETIDRFSSKDRVLIAHDNNLKRIKYYIDNSPDKAYQTISITQKENVQSLFFAKYYNNKSKTYIVTPDDCSSLNFKNNHLHLETDHELFSKVCSYCKNSKKTSHLYFYLLAPYNCQIKIKSDIVLTSPGVFRFSKDNIQKSDDFVFSGDELCVTGNRIRLYSRKRILLLDKAITLSVKIKNISSVPTMIYIGFAPYSEDGILLDSTHYPYKNNNTICSVVDVQPDNNTIIVNVMPIWEKGCVLAYHAEEDLSDIPNTNSLGRIEQITQIDNSHVAIKIDSQIDSSFKTGTNVRVHGTGGTYLYTNVLQLNPNEEQIVSGSITKNNDFLQFSPKFFSRGITYVVPLILSYSINTPEDNSILISDYSVIY